MSADLLREAAQKMRELADAATPAPWVALLDDDNAAVLANAGRGPWVADTVPLGYETRRANAALIAALGPDVARDVAGWLDEVARWVAMSPANPPGGGQRALSISESAWAAMYPAALTVARTFLGRQS